MPRIPSAFNSPDPSDKVPVLFQVLSPDKETLLLPEAMYLHVNPSSLDFSYSKNIARSETRGGFLEQHFGDELTTISADQSTGAFVNTETGLAVTRRRETAAWRKAEQLISIFKSNGSVYDDLGNVRFRGRIRLMFAGGIYDGYFTSFDISESAEEPFSHSLSWDFTVEQERYNILV
jgi:hypothetical protein